MLPSTSELVAAGAQPLLHATDGVVKLNPDERTHRMAGENLNKVIHCVAVRPAEVPDVAEIADSPSGLIWRIRGVSCYGGPASSKCRPT